VHQFGCARVYLLKRFDPVAQPVDEAQPRPGGVDRAHLVVDQPRARPASRTAPSPRLEATPEARLATPATSAVGLERSAQRGQLPLKLGALGEEATITSKLPGRGD